MNRLEIEIKLNRDRAWLLETLAAMPEDELYAPRTFSEHDRDGRWSYADHFIHTTLIERNWNVEFQVMPLRQPSPASRRNPSRMRRRKRS